VLQIGIERLKTEVPSARAAFKAQLEKLQTEAKGTVVEEALNLVGGSGARRAHAPERGTEIEIRIPLLGDERKLRRRLWRLL
jgi:hypothetical protein